MEPHCPRPTMPHTVKSVEALRMRTYTANRSSTLQRKNAFLCSQVPGPLVPSGTTAQSPGPKIPLSEKFDGNPSDIFGVPQSMSPAVLLDPILNDFDEFVCVFSFMFDDPHCARSTKVTLQSLKQGPRPVATYATHFRHLVSDMAWNESAQIYHFYLGLTDEIKDKLARVDTSTALLPYLKLCIQIDNRLSDARKEGRSLPSLAIAEPEPTQVDLTRRRLSDREKEYRHLNYLCLYCGERGHFATKCPLKGEVLISPLSPAPETPSPQSRGEGIGLRTGSRREPLWSES
uniref:CCHC-type domain-containing protein n=1 Tax=Chrysemys picta bellii TaxID=8478 RepID=A0A8C3IUX7_CHRPI